MEDVGEQEQEDTYHPLGQGLIHNPQITCIVFCRAALYVHVHVAIV